MFRSKWGPIVAFVLRRFRWARAQGRVRRDRRHDTEVRGLHSGGLDNHHVLDEAADTGELESSGDSSPEDAHSALGAVPGLPWARIGSDGPRSAPRSTVGALRTACRGSRSGGPRSTHLGLPWARLGPLAEVQDLLVASGRRSGVHWPHASFCFA